MVLGVWWELLQCNSVISEVCIHRIGLPSNWKGASGKNWHKMPRKIGKGYLMNSEQQTSSELQTFDLLLLLIWSSEIHFWTWLLKKSKLVVWRWRKHRRGAPTPETLWCTCGCIWTSSRGLCHSSAPVPWHGTVSSYPPPCILGSRHGACWSCKTTEEQKHTIIEQSCC